MEEHRKLIRQRIKEAFEELLMEKSYSRITMGDVAKRSGIARNTLYNYVSDKAELFGHVAADHLLLSDTFERIASDESMSATDRLERMVEYLFDTYATDQLSTRIFAVGLANMRNNDSEKEYPVIRRLVRFMVEIVRGAQAENLIGLQGNPEVIVTLLAGVLVNALTLVEDGKDKIPETRAITLRFLLNAFQLQEEQPQSREI